MRENRKKWVAALRSGNYRQTTHRLCNNGSYCCLGVACDLYQKEVGDLIIREQGGAIYYNDHISVLPTKVKNWLGLLEDLGFHIKTDGQESSLSALNDTGMTFAEIADIIEAEPEGLCVA